jgi:hypothetical protein
MEKAAQAAFSSTASSVKFSNHADNRTPSSSG